MSNILGARQALELLDRLKTAVRDLSAREERLSQDFQTRAARDLQRRETALREKARQLSAALEQAGAALATAKESAAAKFERRKTRIGQAYQASKEKALVNVDNRIGAGKYDLQKKMLQAERDRDASFAAAAAALEDFKNSLAAEQANLGAVEQSARRSFGGYGRLLQALRAASEKTESGLSQDHHRLLAELRDLLSATQTHLGRFRRFIVLRIFKFWPLWLLIIAGEIPLVLHRYGLNQLAYQRAGECVAASLAALFLIRFFAMRGARPLALTIADTLAKARRTHDAALRHSELNYTQELERTKNNFTTSTQVIDQKLKQSLAQAGEQRVACRMACDNKASRVLERNERLHREKLHRLDHEHAHSMDGLKRADELRRKAETEAEQNTQKKLEAEYEAQWRAIEAEWTTSLRPIYDAITATVATAEKLFPAWTPERLNAWAPPLQFAAAAKFGQLDVNVEKLCETSLAKKRLVLPGPAQFSLPLNLVYPEQGSILFESSNPGRESAIASLNNIILRLLASSPPGRLAFTIIDPVGLGQNFAGIMHIADYEEQIINSRIWTQANQIEQKLADLNEYMEKVIQMYLRNEYATIAEYNEQAGVIAEKYHFLVVADFPANFTETAAKRLLSIAASGARCGVYMLVHWDHRQPLPPEFIPDELRKSCVCVAHHEHQAVLGTKPIPGAEVCLDDPPSAELAIEFVHRIGRSSRDSSRVEVPFAHVAPPDSQMWTEETTSELRVPIGRTGATKFQYLAIGKGTCQHGLIAGKTGSGKSTLFHVIITNLALWCSPEQVEFYLVDFKKGVEFKCYATNRLPHARVVAIESDREFGLSVLQRVDDELKHRGDLFRHLGVQDLAGYKRAGGTEILPRSLLMIDEFQEFFVEDDKIAQTASLLLDRIVRQGRAFGIHVLLGSQTLGGAYTVARTTLGQMVIRIALQCNEADAYLIMDENNPAPRLLSRPGEGIYNDMAGRLEGNSPFQAVWLGEDVRDASLQKVRARADQNGSAWPGPIVFEGNSPADVRENPLLRDLLEAPALQRPAAGRIWLGAPNSIKGPTEVVFHRQGGNNLLIVGQREEAMLAIISLGLVSLAAHFPPGTSRLILCDATPPGTPHREFLDRVLQSIPQPITLAKPGNLPEIMKGLVDDMKKRAEDADPEAAPPVFLFINGLQRFSKLRYEEDFSFTTEDAEAPPNPALLLNELICEGTRFGFHVIATCDTYNNVNRFLSRKALSEFEMRVLFQMSANDSASLIDNPKASLLGLHRALFYNQQEGYLETFRPYALPPAAWIEHAAQSLASVVKAK